MRTWRYEIDHAARIWSLWVQDNDTLLNTCVMYAPFNHRANPGVEVYAAFIVDVCNEKEQRDAAIRRQNGLADTVRVIEVAPLPALKAYPKR